jgi:hypothetical protein
MNTTFGRTVRAIGADGLADGVADGFPDPVHAAADATMIRIRTPASHR